MEVVVFLVVAVLVIAVIYGVHEANENRRFHSKLQEEFPEGKIHVSSNDDSFLVVDFSKERIVIGLRKLRGTLLAQEQPYRSEYPASAIVKAEILKDGTQVASTNRGGQAVGAALGAIAFGGVGAIIGGLSASSTSISGTKRMSIQITVDDLAKPIHEVTFYDALNKKGGKRGNMFFDQGAQQIAEFAAHIEAVIRKSDSANTVHKQFVSQVDVNDKSLAEEIGELWKLKEAGALTQEEFDQEKSRLMSR